MFSVTGMLVVAEHRLEHVLVHAERRGEHAGSDVGHAGELEQPLHGPVLAERPVQHREDDVDVGQRRGDVLDREAHELRTPGRLCQLVTCGRRSSCQRPARSICTGDDLVAALLERRDHAGRRRDRDRVLARAAAEDHGDAPAHGVVVVVVVAVAAGRRRTAAPRGSSRSRLPSRRRRPAGSGREDDPVLARVVDLVEDHRDVKPGALEERRRVGLALAGDVGDLRRRRALRDREGHFEPLATLLPAGGSEATTTPCAWSDWMSTRETVKPWPWSADFAFANGSPVTSGTCTGLRRARR